MLPLGCTDDAAVYYQHAFLSFGKEAAKPLPPDRLRWKSSRGFSTAAYAFGALMGGDIQRVTKSPAIVPSKLRCPPSRLLNLMCRSQ